MTFPLQMPRTRAGTTMKADMDIVDDITSPHIHLEMKTNNNQVGVVGGKEIKQRQKVYLIYWK